MSEVPDNHQLAQQLAVLKERMKTHQATYETALERIERRIAERDTRLLLWIAGMLTLGVTLLGAAITVLGIIIT